MGKTRCFATGEELDWGDCLKCALNPDHPCEYSYALLSALHQDAQRERTPGYHVSEVKGCLRKAWYERTQERPTPYPSEKLILLEGTVMHGALDDASSTVLETETELKWEYQGVTLVGRFDGYSAEFKNLIDYKTTRWLTPSNLPYGDHEKQVRIYANMMRHMGKPVERAEIDYIDLSGPSKCKSCNVPLHPYSPEALVCPSCDKYLPTSEAHLGSARYAVDLDGAESTDEWIGDRLKTLDDCVKSGMEAPAEPTNLCNYCPFRNVCDSALRTRRRTRG